MNSKTAYKFAVVYLTIGAGVFALSSIFRKKTFRFRPRLLRGRICCVDIRQRNLFDSAFHEKEISIIH